MAMAENRVRMSEFDAARRGASDREMVEELQRLERRIFPKHESLAKSFEEELGKKNIGLIYLSEIVTGEGRRGEIVGYVMFSCANSLCASITKLAVKESWRRQGHGEVLLRAAIDKCRARKIQCVSLHVDPARTGAFSLYQKLGFRVDQLIEGYYSPGRHAYRMFLDF